MCTFWGAPCANSCFETMHPIPSLRHSVLHTVGKGKTPMPKTLKEWAFQGYSTGWGGWCISGSREQLIAALYGQPSSSSMGQARYNLYRPTPKQMHIMSLPPMDLIICLHLKRVHFQILLWKTADKLGHLDVSISLRIWLGDQRWTNLS